MASKLGVKDDVAASAPPAGTSRIDAPRRVYRVSPRWALEVNWKLVSALGLALLVWAFIVAVLLVV